MMIVRVIVPENSRGFVFKDGSFDRMLMPGRHWVKKREDVKYSQMRGLIMFSGSPYVQGSTISSLEAKTLMLNREIKDSVIQLDVPDTHFALHYEDGHYKNKYNGGIYCFWDALYKNTFTLIDKTKPEITEVDEQEIRSLPTTLYHKIVIPQGHQGLLYFDGVFQKMLDNGVYFYWKGDVNVNLDLIDLRSTQIEILGQEILTADKVGLRINFVCNYQITDAVGIMQKIDNYKDRLYVATQLILREYVGKYRLDELLAQKEEIASFVLAQLKTKEEELFVKFIDAGVKDIILPGEIRDIMNTVLVAEKRAQANVITRREEVASTRSLLNTAKLMEDNQTLYKLKELEYLERICEQVGNISVGSGDLLEQLGMILNTR